MASPTAIPHCETSAHHQPATPPPNSSSSFSRSPTGTSPNPIMSPIYTSAGRSAFSLPGPNSSSTSPTTTSWYSAGFASNNSQRVRSPTSNFVTSSVTPQRDYFAESTSATSPPTSAHFRTASFGGSTSRSSSISSADLMSEPTTPKPMEGVGGGGAPLGRVSSIPMGSSFDQIKGHRGSWGPHSNGQWNGLNSFRGTNNQVSVENNGSVPASNGGMSGILRKFSFGSGSQPLKAGLVRNTSSAAVPMATSAPPQQTLMANADSAPVEIVGRGRQGSVGGGGMQKRRPSPMGERLLMGHFNAH